MNRDVFTDEYHAPEYALIRKHYSIVQRDCELAQLRSLCTRVLQAGGSVLHGFFLAGDFPKSCEMHRKSLMLLSDELNALHSAVMAKPTDAREAAE